MNFQLVSSVADTMPTIVPCFNGCKCLLMVLHKLGNSQEQVSALRRCNVSPRRAFERRTSCKNSIVYVLICRSVYCCDFGLITDQKMSVPTPHVLMLLQTYAGLMLTIISSFRDFTHSLLMKRPIGCSYRTPFGVFSCLVKPDMIDMLRILDLRIFISLVSEGA